MRRPATPGVPSTAARSVPSTIRLNRSRAPSLAGALLITARSTVGMPHTITSGSARSSCCSANSAPAPLPAAAAALCREVAEALRLDHGTLTPLLKRMEGAGLIERTRHPDDERSVLVRLTPAGRSLEEHREPITCRVEETLGLSGEQTAALRDLLRVVQLAPDPADH